MVHLCIRTMSEQVKRHILCIQALNRYNSTKLKSSLCTYNILKKNIPLTELQRRRLSNYKTKLRELSQRRAHAAYFNHRSVRVRAGASVGLPSAVGKFGLSTLAPPRGAAQEVEMEHARKMALVDPRLLDTSTLEPRTRSIFSGVVPEDGLPTTIDALLVAFVCNTDDGDEPVDTRRSYSL